ncbi:MAG: hypothetical protein GY906_05590 [bacterium]|nr:hypothetical protein [bacterium]
MRISRIQLALFIILTSVLLTPSTIHAQAFLLGFDWDASGNTVPTGAMLSSTYSALGLKFSHTGPTVGSCTKVRASDFLPFGFGSPPNAITLCPSSTWSDISENVHGLIRMVSNSPLSSVCIGVKPNGSAGAGVMRAYDGGGTLIEEATSNPGVTETLCTSGRRIRSVEFSGHGNKYAVFDNLGIAGPGLGPTYHFVPGAANIPGENDASWKTDLEVHNPSNFDVEITIAVLPRHQANPTPWAERTFTIPANSSRRFENVLATTFRFTGAATLRVAALGTVNVTARTYNHTPEGRYGQFIPGKTIAEAISPGRQGRMIQLSQSDTNDTGQRTNIGLVNAENFSIKVWMALYDGEGNLFGEFSTHLKSLMSVQYDKVFRIYTSNEVEDGYAIVWSNTPEAVFFAFATPVDNPSGDGFYFPAIVE